MDLGEHAGICLQRKEENVSIVAVNGLKSLLESVTTES